MRSIATAVGGCVLFGLFTVQVVGAAADPDEPIACKKLVVKFDSKFKLRCDIDELPSPQNAPSHDNGLVVARLTIDNVGVGITGQGFSDPWKALGPNGVRGYRSGSAVCRARLSNRRLVLRCKDASSTTSTQLPVPDRLNISFTTYGATLTDSKTYCLSSAGGTVLQNSGSRLVIKNMPAPVDCSFLP